MAHKSPLSIGKVLCKAKPTEVMTSFTSLSWPGRKWFDFFEWNDFFSSRCSFALLSCPSHLKDFTKNFKVMDKFILILRLMKSYIYIKKKSIASKDSSFLCIKSKNKHNKSPLWFKFHHVTVPKNLNSSPVARASLDNLFPLFHTTLQQSMRGQFPLLRRDRKMTLALVLCPKSHSKGVIGLNF